MVHKHRQHQDDIDLSRGLTMFTAPVPEVIKKGKNGWLNWKTRAF